MKTLRAKGFRAFTIIELLLVIAIMVVVAGLIVWGAGRGSEQKKIARAEVEKARLVTLIEAYKLKLGVYPPQNTNNPARNSLFYELAGAFRDAAPPNDSNPIYRTPFGNVRSNELFAEFEITGLVNASDDATEIKRFLKDIKPDQFAITGNYNVRRLVVPVDGPDDSNPRPNFWNYLAGTNEVGKLVHNPDSFDLWADIKVRGVPRTIGNWKD